MELGSTLVVIITCSVILLGIVVLYYGYRLGLKKRRAAQAREVNYDEARRIARNLLKERYQGKRGFIKPYTDEFGFKHSAETLRKALQETNPTPNLHYVQRVLDDLEPGKYKVQPPTSANQSSVA